MVRVIGAVLALVAMCGDPAIAQRVLFTGVVLSDSARTPISDADVLLTDLAVTVRSNTLGAFRITQVPAGAHSLLVRKVGFLPLETTLTFPADRDVERRIYLVRITTLDSVNVVAQGSRRATFDEHRRRGIGSFLERSQLDERETRRLGDLLASLKGVRILGRTPHAYAVSPHGGSVPCFSQVYINGALTYEKQGDPLVDLNTFATEQIDAVEYYASDTQAPVEYRGMHSDCGVLVIWTRHTRGPAL